MKVALRNLVLPHSLKESIRVVHTCISVVGKHEVPVL